MNVLCGWEMLKTKSSNRQNVVEFIAAGRTETWINKKEGACIAFSFVVSLCCLMT